MAIKRLINNATGDSKGYNLKRLYGQKQFVSFLSTQTATAYIKDGDNWLAVPNLDLVANTLKDFNYENTTIRFNLATAGTIYVIGDNE